MHDSKHVVMRIPNERNGGAVRDDVAVTVPGTVVGVRTVLLIEKRNLGLLGLLREVTFAGL